MGRQLVPSTTVLNFKFIVNARAMSSFKIVLFFMVVAAVMLIQTEKAEAADCKCHINKRGECQPVQLTRACPNSNQVCTCPRNANVNCALRGKCKSIGG